MNRLTRFAFSTLALLAILAPQAHAQSGQIPKTIVMGFHTTLDPSTFASASIAYINGDSATVYRGTGLRNSAQQIDTTVALNLRQFTLPGPYATAAAADTIGWLRFTIYPVGTSPTVAADSAVVTLQLSEDKVNWTGTTWSGPYASTGTTPTSAIILTEGTSKNFHYIVRQATGAFGPFQPITTTTLNATKCFGYKWMRLIVQGDLTGQYAMDVTGFIPNAGPTYSP
jgi:hypothetical protein